MCQLTKNDDKNIDENTLIQYGKKYIQMRDSQRERAYNYYVKMKDNEDFKERLKANKQSYYQKHKDSIREKERTKYINNTEYHDKIRERAKQKYLEKSVDIPKTKRGRKPKPVDENNISIPKRRGRPSLKDNSS